MIAHAKGVLLTDARPKVSEAGRQRVLRDKKKNVHAGLTGCMVALYDGNIIKKLTGEEMLELLEWTGTPNMENTRQVTYNPYKYQTFVNADDLSEYKGSEVAVLHGRYIGVANPVR